MVHQQQPKFSSQSVDRYINAYRGQTKLYLLIIVFILFSYVRISLSFQFCQMHGFICELCNDSKSIFPWDLERIHRCNKCGSCYHVKCFTKIRICPKCLRRSNRHDRWNCIQADDGWNIYRIGCLIHVVPTYSYLYRIMIFLWYVKVFIPRWYLRLTCWNLFILVSL